MTLKKKSSYYLMSSETSMDILEKPLTDVTEKSKRNFQFKVSKDPTEVANNSYPTTICWSKRRKSSEKT